MFNLIKTLFIDYFAMLREV